jgi:hypothetical protein
MKKIFLFLSIFMLAALGCDLSVSVAPSTSPASLPTNTTIPAGGDLTQIPPSPTLVPATSAPSATAAMPPAFEGTEVSTGPLRIVLPPGLASGAHGSQIPRADGENFAPWDVTPGHTVLTLEGYPLQGKTHQPQIYVYPALDYAQMLPGAFESIHRLDNILYGPAAPLSADQLPAVPFFNAQQVFASNIQMVSFQNGGGVRFLTEYVQYPASANNQDLFYHFEGVTRDGVYYIIAILPISNTRLAETSDGGAVLPSGGVPYPYFADPTADMQAYYTAVTDLLDASSPEAFTPAIDRLDLLIQSMRVAP